MDLDGQSIEKRDFPVVRRGYEPAAVDAHLHSVANAVRELSEKTRRGESVGATAAAQVQGIIDAAEASAAQMLGDAKAEAANTIEQARLSAEGTRSDAIAQSDAYVAAVAAAAATLRSRVESMDADLQTLLDTLRSGGSRLAQELGAIEHDLASLYDAAGARRGTQSQSPEPRGLAAVPLAAAELPAAAAISPSTAASPATTVLPPAAMVAPSPASPSPAPASSSAASGVRSPSSTEAGSPASGNGELSAGAGAAPPPSADIDGARLIALNMALNGDSPEQTEHYLAEHFDLPERAKLVAEVYAAIEG